MMNYLRGSLVGLGLVYGALLNAGVPDVAPVLKVQKSFVRIATSDAYYFVNIANNTLDVFATLQMSSACAEPAVGFSIEELHKSKLRLRIDLVAVSDNSVSCIEIYPAPEFYQIMSVPLDAKYKINEVFLDGDKIDELR